MNILTQSQASAVYAAAVALNSNFSNFSSFSSAYVNDVTKAAVVVSVSAAGAVFVVFTSPDTGCGHEVKRRQEFCNFSSFCEAHRIAYVS